ncbi:MAG: hypothetical protein AAGA62_10785 [Bacteroidota bacterium]
MRFLTLTSLFFITIITIGGCTKDSLPEPEPSLCEGGTPTYEVEIRPIIEASCAYSGCHLGGAPGLYNSYDGLLANLNDGTFRQRVISQMDDPNVGMPPNYAPSDRPQDLTSEELNLIECWLDAGFPRE